jgi:hypothetical protein
MNMSSIQDQRPEAEDGNGLAIKRPPAWLVEGDRQARRQQVINAWPRDPLILFANRQFDRSWIEAGAAAESGRLRLTEDLNRWPEAQAVVFHLPERQTLDHLAKPPGQLWIGVTQECDVYYPWQADPDWMSRIDVLASYHRSADIALNYTWPSPLEECFQAPSPKSDEALVCALVSNDHSRSDRERWLTEIEQWLPVHHYGRWRRNRPSEIDLGRETKLALLRRYRFNLAFENSIDRDYVTEKWFDCFIAGCVPVYLGAPNIGDYAPAPGSYLNAADWSPRELAMELQALAADPQRYGKFFAWKQNGASPAFQRLYQVGHQPLTSRLWEWLQSQRSW